MKFGEEAAYIIGGINHEKDSDVRKVMFYDMVEEKFHYTTSGLNLPRHMAGCSVIRDSKNKTNKYILVAGGVRMNDNDGLTTTEVS